MPSVLQTESGAIITDEGGAPILRDNKRVLTPRTYLGTGYFHHFKNNTTQEEVLQSCTQGEYNALAAAGGGNNPPTLTGHTWLYSTNGAVQVDTPSGLLGNNEYTTIGSDKIVGQDNTSGVRHYRTVPSSAVDAQHKIDVDVYLQNLI